MVEYQYNLDTIFGSLSDSTRRDILRRIVESEVGLSIGAIAEHYKVSFAAVAKHLNVLEKAHLIKKTRNGKQQIITIEAEALETASAFLETYRLAWEESLDSLGEYLKSTKNKKDKK